MAGEEVYCADPTLRRHGLGYVLQVAGNRLVATRAGPIRVDALPATLPITPGRPARPVQAAKGPRYYAWAWIALHPDNTGQHHLPIRATTPPVNCPT